MNLDIQHNLVNTVRLLKSIIPIIDDAIEYMQDSGGWLPLNDQFLSAINNLKITDWAKYYMDENKFKAVGMLGLVGEEGLRDITDPDLLKKEIKTELAEFLEEGDLVPPTEEEIERLQAEFKASSCEERQAISKQAAFFLLAFVTSLFHYLALMVHGRTMCQLVAAAAASDDDAYRRAVQIDRTVLYLPYFRDRLVRAQFDHDAVFMKRVGDSFKRPILSSRIRYRTLWLAFAILDDEGLLGIPHEQLLDICEQAGVYGKQHGIEDVGHIRKRLHDYRMYQRNSKIF